jgi:HAD superfamily hydrolase (TIGR01490 family)
MQQRLVVFDLDNTLLTGDSEVLWVDFLLACGELDESFAARNADMDRRYHAGTATAAEFCSFYASTFAGRTPGQWAPIRAHFFHTVLVPRLCAAAFALVRQHRAAGDLLVLSTAASRFLCEPSARALGFEHLIATEMGQHDDGRFAGENTGTLNMREGKVTRLAAWLAEQGRAAEPVLAEAVFYSDSVNDLPLLLAVGHPVAVDPDTRLAAEALARHWPVLKLDRSFTPTSA